MVTHTTRPKRNGEQDGSDYYFETKETFFDKHYLEYVTYDDNYYGSSFEGLERALNQTKRAVIVLDTQGVLTYLDKLPAKLLTVIFLELPSKAVQVKRLYARGDKKLRSSNDWQVRKLNEMRSYRHNCVLRPMYCKMQNSSRPMLNSNNS